MASQFLIAAAYALVISRSMLCHSDGICYNRLADEHGTAGDNGTEDAAQRTRHAGLRKFALRVGECFDALSRVLSSTRAESLQVDLWYLRILYVLFGLLLRSSAGPGNTIGT